jgi:hypothetical protein
MVHDHVHDHGGHTHGVSADADRGKLAITLGLRRHDLRAQAH